MSNAGKATGKIRTVTGDILAGEAGFTQSHEHILLRKGHSWEVNPVLWQDEPEKSLRELHAYRAAGGAMLVDAQPVGCGRMAEQLREISAASGVKIVASTGFHKLLFYPEEHWIFSMGRRELSDLYVRELTEGMYEDGDEALPAQPTDVKAGQIKTALDTEGLTQRYRTLFLAAADAAAKTGAPIMIHVENGTDPRELLFFLLEQGLPPQQLIFCHLDRACPQLDIHKEILSAEAYLEYDTIGRFKYHSDEEEIRIIEEMIMSGYVKQLLFSLDTTRERLGAYGGKIALTYLIEHFLPLCREKGIEETALHAMAVDNPAEAFSCNT